MTTECYLDKTFRPAVVSDIPVIVDNLLPAAKADINRAGVNPVLTMLLDMALYKVCVMLSPDGQPMALIGVNSDGNIWMHMTNETMKYPKAFMKAAKLWLSNQPHKLLYNYIDINNTALLKMVKRLGFKFLRVVPMTRNNLYYVEFVRLWDQQRY
jgi:hypothetical protein